MSERYTRLFSLPENIGQDGCPVLISAGALLKDNNTGKVLVQLKLRNISEQVIKSVKIKVNAYDTAGGSLNGVEDFSYLDLAVERDGEFGSKTPVILPDKTTRSVSIEILSVVYESSEVYQAINGVATDFIDNKTAEKVQLLDNERKEREIVIQQEKKRKALSSLLFSPLIIDVLAIILRIAGGYFNIGYWGQYCVSLIIPCLCIWNYFQKDDKRVFKKISPYITTLFLIVQILAAVYYQYGTYNEPAIPIFYHLSTRYIGGSHIFYNFKFLNMRPFIFDIDTVLSWIAEYIFVAKNICAVIVLFLQNKIIHK